ncbi:YwdI family protein [Paraliobacillus sp. JSM ZJ581]|uniref:YwdI family protein n=1 Tax=Paraliobacillus sp. JSM ZJ581 TaxID=3342118 RepID=UPI0035A99876
MIRNEQVLHKMLQEVKSALEKSNHSTEVKAHVRSIRLLCDLLLETEEEVSTTAPTSVQQSSVADELELRKMMGDLNSQTVNQSKRLKEEEANGDSIFDF